MLHSNRFAASALAGALALTVGLARRADAGHAQTAPAGPRSSSAGHASSGSSHQSSSGRVSSGSTRRDSSGHVSTSPAPPRGSFRGGDALRGRTWGGDRAWNGRSGGGYWSGGGWRGGHWPHWYTNWYWGYAPYWCTWGWLWGSPWYWDPFFSDWRYVRIYGDGPYYSDVYSWRSTHRAWASRFGRVKTDVEPDEAELWLNGKYIGTADDFDGFPDYLYLEPGSYKLEFRLTGYQNWDTDVTVARGEMVKLDHQMTHEPGKGRLSSFLPEPKGMPDGRFFGKDGLPVAPEVKTEVKTERQRMRSRGDDAPIGIDDDKPRTDVKAEKARADDDEGEDVEAPPEKDVRVDEPRASAPPAEIPARARIRWDVSPEDAAVWIDDEYAGTGDELSTRPRGTFTTPGKHTVTVVRPGYKTKTVEVEAKSGEAVDVVVALGK